MLHGHDHSIFLHLPRGLAGKLTTRRRSKRPRAPAHTHFATGR